MASSGKPKTTWAKLQREAARRERRQDKAIRKQIRKQEAQLEPSTAVESDAEAEDTGAVGSGTEPDPAATS